MNYNKNSFKHNNNNNIALKYQKSGISSDEINELKDAFDLFDTNKTGYIELNELSHALSTLIYNNNNHNNNSLPTPQNRKNKMISQILTKIDKESNKSNKIDFDIFLNIMTSKITNKDSKENILKIFDLFDYNNKGNINFDDLKRVCMELGEDISNDELKEMISRADLDGKGFVNKDEFFKVMTKKNFK